jgi:hypothetical protein
VISRGGTTTVGMKNAAPSILGSSRTPNNACQNANRRSAAPHTLNSHTSKLATDVRVESAMVAAIASMAATRSPYAAGAAKADGSRERQPQALGS